MKKDFREFLTWKCVSKTLTIPLVQRVQRIPIDGDLDPFRQYKQLSFVHLERAVEQLDTHQHIRHLKIAEFDTSHHTHPSRKEHQRITLYTLEKIAKNIETLYIQSMGLSQFPTPTFRLFSRLTSLYIGWYRGIIPKELAHLEKLELYSPQNDDMMEEIHHLQSLKHLIIKGRDMMFRHDRNLKLLSPTLKTLDLEYCLLSDYHILSSLTSLTELTCYFNVFTFDPLVLLPLKENLRYLNVSDGEHRHYCRETWKRAGVTFDKLCIQSIY